MVLQSLLLWMALDYPPELTAEIIKRLSEEDELDHVILDLCEATHLASERAKKQISQIRDNYVVKTTKKRFCLGSP
jgi:hypothetical protein